MSGSAPPRAPKFPLRLDPMTAPAKLPASVPRKPVAKVASKAAFIPAMT